MPKIELKYIFDDLDDFQRYMDGAETKAVPVTGVVNAEDEERAAAPTQTPAAAPTGEITENVDKDGLPYDPEIHATPKSMTADGLWRAKRGKSEEAAQARAAFKAAGGAFTPPPPPPPAAPSVPLTNSAVAMPGMPVAQARAPEPITYDKLVDKTVGMMERGVLDSDTVLRLYSEIGLTEVAVLETNETMRAALYAKLCEIEPVLV